MLIACGRLFVDVDQISIAVRSAGPKNSRQRRWLAGRYVFTPGMLNAAVQIPSANEAPIRRRVYGAGVSATLELLGHVGVRMIAGSS